MWEAARVVKVGEGRRRWWGDLMNGHLISTYSKRLYAWAIKLCINIATHITIRVWVCAHWARDMTISHIRVCVCVCMWVCDVWLHEPTIYISTTELRSLCGQLSDPCQRNLAIYRGSTVTPRAHDINYTITCLIGQLCSMLIKDYCIHMYMHVFHLIYRQLLWLPTILYS